MSVSVSAADRRGRTVLSTAAASTAIGDGDGGQGQVIASTPSSDGGEATVATSIFNLAKSIMYVSSVFPSISFRTIAPE